MNNSFEDRKNHSRNKDGFSHELVVPNKGLPFKMFRFEGASGNYYREKHWHRSVEMFMVLSGNLTFYLGEKKILLSDDELILVNTNEVHSIWAAKANETIVLQMPISLFEPVFTDHDFIWFENEKLKNDKNLKSYIRRIYQEIDLAEAEKTYGVQAIFYEFLQYLVKKYRVVEPEDELVSKARNLGKLRNVTRYMKEHYREELTLTQVAEEFNYSPAYLSRMFTQNAGVGYKEYLDMIRLEKGRKLLEETDIPVGELAMQAGFPNIKAFSKLYRNTYGLLPSEYRKFKKI